MARVLVKDTSTEERERFHRFGDGLVVVTLTTGSGETIEVAAGDRLALLGPFEASAS